VGGQLLVHSEIYYVPVGDGWKEVLVRNVLHNGYIKLPMYLLFLWRSKL
jgi:hypothetical protein